MAKYKVWRGNNCNSEWMGYQIEAPWRMHAVRSLLENEDVLDRDELKHIVVMVREEDGRLYKHEASVEFQINAGYEVDKTGKPVETTKNQESGE